MASTTKIEWATKSWNPLAGCSKVSEGCRNCYAMRMAQRLAAMALTDIEAGRNPGRKGYYVNVVRYAEPAPGAVGAGLDTKPLPQWNGVVELIAEALHDPLHWRTPQRVFVNSMSDLFHAQVPFGFADAVFAIINATHIYPPKQGHTPDDARLWHNYLILTKRPENMAKYVASRNAKHYGLGEHPIIRVRGEVFRGQGRALMNSAAIVVLPPQNAMLGVSIENQQEADKRREHMRAIAEAGWQTWVSYEPALGPVDWTGWEFIKWMVSGGESGKDARPSHPDWHRSTLDWCQLHRVPYFFKQWGAWAPTDDDDPRFDNSA